MNIRASLNNLSKFEVCLWLGSLVIVAAASALGGSGGLLPTLASLIGVTALIFVAKGDVLGQLLIVVFSLLYGLISLTFRYYGEMITYLGMTAPIAVLAVISWLRHPFQGAKQEVAVNRLGRLELLLTFLATGVITAMFYGILRAFGTANLLPSTVSVATSFLASYLTFRRSPFYALAYAANDLVLIVLWGMAAVTDLRYLSMAVCFLIFFVNDLYGYFCWAKMEKRQAVATALTGN